MSYLAQNLGKRKIVALSICFMLILGVIGLYVWKSIADQRGSVPAVAGYDDIANDIPKSLKPMVMGSVADMLKKNNPASTDFSASNPKVRHDSFTTTPPNADGIIQAKFFVDSDPLKQSYVVYVSYYKDSSDQFAGPPSVRCITNKDDLIYGEFACKEISPVTDKSDSDPLLANLPHRDPYYFMSGYVDDKGVKRVTVDIDLNVNSVATRKAFEDYKASSLRWITSQNADPKSYSIEWRDLRRSVISTN